MMRSVVLASVLGGSLGLAACLLELDNAIACGDGYVDIEAGEECDPGDTELLTDRCSCDPVTCQQECCGDRVINNDEECDGLELGLVGPGGDPSAETCQSYTPAGATEPYASGNLRCSSDCRIDESACTLCGNGHVDPLLIRADGSLLPEEKCDGPQPEDEVRWATCAPACGLPPGTQVWCNVVCDGCWLVRPQEPISCCFPQRAPKIDDAFPCCCSLDPRGCEFPIAGEGEQEPVCPGVDLTAGG